MTATSRVLIPAKQAEAALTTQYTSTNCKTIVDLFTVTNTSAGPQALDVYVVTSGDTAGASNQIVKTLSVASNETKLVSGLIGRRLDAGGFIATNASDGASLTIRADGRQITS